MKFHARPGPSIQRICGYRDQGHHGNWQSEFLQLIWQIIGLSFLWHVGSPQSKEGDDRREAKLDHLLKKPDPEGAETFLRSLEKKYPKK